MANDFSGDGSIKLLYKLDNGVLTVDDIGSNTLTNLGTVISNTTDEQEGDGCAEFSGSNALYITDSNLDPGVPFKSGESNKNMTVCLFFNPSSLENNDRSIAAKYDSTGGDRSWRLKIENDNNSFYWAHGYNSGGTFEQSAAFGSAFTVDHWYHGGFTLDEDDNYRARIYDITADEFLDTDLTGTFPNATSITTAVLMFGGHGTSSSVVNGMAGLEDEPVVFDEIKSTSVIDEIRQQIYGASTTLLPIIMNYNQKMRS